MGQSTDAIFGFGWVGEDDFSVDYEDDDEDPLWNAMQACEKLGVKLGTHCSGECPMPYLACDSGDIRHVVAWRGHPIRMSVQAMETLAKGASTAEGATKALVAAVAMLHADYPSVAAAIGLPSAADVEFTWFLCSDWN